ncbi:MAG: PepSY domain-containing protein [Rubrivivax sp.]|nr:PepSY domain-containing protein [Rubrivivax sp.]
MNSLSSRFVLCSGRFALWAVLATALALPAAQASERDHERARAAVQAGEVLPLATLLERLQRTHPGQVLELELERDNGRWIYEVKLLQANGQLMKLELDASTAQVLQVKRREDKGGKHGRRGPPVEPQQPAAAAIGAPR